MKAFISIIATIYLFFNLGLGMNMHYCMGFLKEVSFGHEKHACCCGTEILMDSCCEDIHINLSLDDDQLLSSVNVLPVTPIAILPEYFVEKDQVFSNQKTDNWKSSGNDPPPKKSDSRIYIHSLVLYA